MIHHGISGGPSKTGGQSAHLKKYGTPWNLSRLSFQIFLGNFTITDGNINPACWDCSKIFFEENNIKAFYVTSVNRLTRMSHGFRLIYEFCRYNNVSICSGLQGSYDNPPLDSRINRNDMFKLAMDAELQHMDFCISAQNSQITRRRNRDMDEQNPEQSENVNELEEALVLAQVSERPRRLSLSEIFHLPDEQSTSQHTSTDSFNLLSRFTRAIGM